MNLSRFHFVSVCVPSLQRWRSVGNRALRDHCKFHHHDGQGQGHKPVDEFCHRVVRVHGNVAQMKQVADNFRRDTPPPHALDTSHGDATVFAFSTVRCSRQLTTENSIDAKLSNNTHHAIFQTSVVHGRGLVFENVDFAPWAQVDERWSSDEQHV